MTARFTQRLHDDRVREPHREVRVLDVQPGRLWPLRPTGCTGRAWHAQLVEVTPPDVHGHPGVAAAYDDSNGALVGSGPRFDLIVELLTAGWVLRV